MRISDWSSNVCSSDLLAALRVRVDVGEDAEAELRIGIEQRARRPVVLAEMILDEVCVGQRALQVMAHRLTSGRAGVGGERLMAVRRKLLQGVAHRAWHSVLGKNLRENARAPGRFPDRKSTRLHSSH